MDVKAQDREFELYDRLSKVMQQIAELHHAVNEIVSEGYLRPSPLLAILHRCAGAMGRISSTSEGEEVGDYPLGVDGPWAMADRAYADRGVCDIIQYDFWDREGDHMGALVWTESNDGIEKLVDWTVRREGGSYLDELIESVMEEYRDE